MFNKEQIIQPLPQDISKTLLPEEFTFPFFYSPHPLAIAAAESLQAYLEHQRDFVHNFGLEEDQEGLKIGKMFGVLVIEKTQGGLGYLAAFSGKLADTNDIAGFVPPVYNMLQHDGFYKPEEEELNAINQSIIEIENATATLELYASLAATNENAELSIAQFKNEIVLKKQARNNLRMEALTIEMSDDERQKLSHRLSQESYQESSQLKVIRKEWKERIAVIQEKISSIEDDIMAKKQLRQEKSHKLQMRLFDSYTFMNSRKEVKSLNDIFHKNPPSGAGECAAPKLLQYAFLHDLRPVAMAEFWWGASPSAEVRIHKQYYPSCRGKCEPILGYMLQGMKVAPNPMLQDNNYHIQSLKVIYEDQWIVVIDKPHELLSVPGKHIKTSVYSILKGMYPHASGPLIVHRLDMSTSGILLVAKDIDTYKKLQKQFIQKKIYKEYHAILDGIIELEEGEIDLPLRVDLDNRPQQMVCYEYGSHALTRYKVIKKSEDKTLISFIPITGRTHQLRVHASHSLGLGVPISGDDIYGVPADRLMLHASLLQFYHPVMKQEMTITSTPPFMGDFFLEVKN